MAIEWPSGDLTHLQGWPCNHMLKKNYYHEITSVQMLSFISLSDGCSRPLAEICYIQGSDLAGVTTPGLFIWDLQGWAAHVHPWDPGDGLCVSGLFS
jgi:hypothetical protein